MQEDKRVTLRNLDRYKGKPMRKRNFMWLAGLLGLCAMVGFAPSAHATTCTTGTLASYIALGATGCTLDGLTFNNFGYTPTNAPAATSITVTPSLLGLLFQFNSSWFAGSGQVVDSTIVFTISAASAIINDLTLSLDAAACTGTGTVGLTENASNGVTLLATCINGTITNPAPVTFAPVKSLTVHKDLGLNGNTGTAAVSQFTNSVSTVVPEPGTLALFGSGLLGIAGAIRRRLKS